MVTTIQNVSLTDFDRIAAIYQFYVEKTPASFEAAAPSGQQFAARWQQCGEMPFIVAYQQQHLVGFAYVSPYHHREAYRFTVENTIYLDPAHTQKGIGGLLLAHLIEACRQHNFKEIISRIAIWEGSEASIRLHKKFGFQEKGCLTKVGFKFDKFIDTLLMQKSL